MEIATFELPKPRSNSHEALAFSACPLCHAPSIHLRAMKSHLMAVHRGAFDEAVYERACQARLALYEHEIGHPLPYPDEAERRHREMERQAQLPTITPQGHYACNWCLVRLKPFPTRDAFLQHVAVKHPEQDMDEVERAVPVRVPRENSGPSVVVAGVAVTGQTPSHPTAAVHRPTLGAVTLPPLLRGAGRTNGASGPTRRLQGVQPLVNQAMQDLQRLGGRKPFPSATQRSPRQSGVSVPRHLDAGGAREAAKGWSENVVQRPEEGGGVGAGDESTSEAVLHRARSIRFGNGRYPCELCGRVLVSELDLLQHLEMRHPEVNAPGVPSGNAPRTVAAACDDGLTSSSSAAGGLKLNLGSLMRAEMGGGKKGKKPVSTSSSSLSTGGTGAMPAALSGQLVVSCDLCSSSKVYTLASALFAHIRFKHPAEDAAFHVERLIEASKHVTQRFICSHCSKAFSSEDALQGHISSKHQSQPDSPTVTRNPATAGLLGVVAEKNQWWCNECEKGFRSGRALLGHKVSKHLHDLKSHNCPACKRVFTDVFSLEEHMKQVHPTLSIDDLGLIAGVLCQYCDRRFLEVKDLQQHLLRHHPGKSTLTKEAPVVSSSGGVGFVDPLRRNTVPLHLSGAPNSPSAAASASLHPKPSLPGISRLPSSHPSMNMNNGSEEAEALEGSRTSARTTSPVPGSSPPPPPSKPRKVIRKKV